MTTGSGSHRIAPYIAVLVLAMLAGLAALDAKQTSTIRRDAHRDAWARYDSAMASCLRGNTIRRELHRVAAAQRVTASTLAAFLRTSATFRRSQNKEGLARQSEAAAALLAEVAGRLNPPTTVSCVDAIDRPPYERPRP